MCKTKTLLALCATHRQVDTSAQLCPVAHSSCSIISQINDLHHLCSLRLRRQASYLAPLGFLLRHLSLPEGQALSLSLMAQGARPQSACILRCQVPPPLSSPRLTLTFIEARKRRFIGLLGSASTSLQGDELQFSSTFSLEKDAGTWLVAFSRWEVLT